MNRCTLALVACSVLAMTSGCNHAANTSKNCAEIHLTYYPNDYLHIGVFGDKKISDTSCFKLVNEDTGNEVKVEPDPVDGVWGKVASYTNLPITESLITLPGPGNYVLTIPKSWVNDDRNQKARIAFSTTTMGRSVGIGPESFEGEKPPRVNLSIGWP